MIADLRTHFNRNFTAEKYQALLAAIAQQCGAEIGFRVAETPIFLPLELLHSMAASGVELTTALLANPAYLAAAAQAIPPAFRVPALTPHPNFLTADFALVRTPDGQLTHRLVEIQAFPSVYGYQTAMSDAYRRVYDLPGSLGSFLSGLDESSYWALLAKTVLGSHDPEHVVLTELDPLNQKTWPDFAVTARRLGVAVVDIRSLEPVGDKLHYRNAAGRLVPIHRIYNRAIADELIARNIQLPYSLTRPWDVEWAGHPNWYFLISKFSLPWLSNPPGAYPVVPPAAFLDDFLAGPGHSRLASAGVSLASHPGRQTTYPDLLLKPLFSFAGKGIEFDPSQARLEEIPAAERPGYLLQQRMDFVPTIETPHGLTQAEVRILYLWPEGASLTPVLSLVRLGRGKMMGVDHNRNQQWVGASSAFFPTGV